MNGDISPEARGQVDALLKQSFRPEFLNRLDEIVCFKPLTRDNVRHIIDLMLAQLNARLAERELAVEATEAARDFILEAGYDPHYGARPLRRYLQHTVETLISKKIIADVVAPGQTLKLDVTDGELTVV